MIWKLRKTLGRGRSLTRLVLLVVCFAALTACSTTSNRPAAVIASPVLCPPPPKAQTIIKRKIEPVPLKHSGRWYAALEPSGYESLARYFADVLTHIEQRNINDRYMLACIEAHNAALDP